MPHFNNVDLTKKGGAHRKSNGSGIVLLQAVRGRGSLFVGESGLTSSFSISVWPVSSSVIGD